MYCTACGKGLPTEKAQFCPICGAKQVPAVVSAPVAPAAPYEYVQTELVPRKSGQGMGIAGLIIGIIGLFIGLYDYSLLQGAYTYILSEEIGLLFIISAAGIIFSSVGVVRKSQIATWALIVSALSMLLTFYLASFG